MLKKSRNQIISKARTWVRAIVDKANLFFNGLSARYQKAALLIFGIAMGGISFMLIMQALNSQENTTTLSVESINTPKDIFMRENDQAITEDQLIPVGKLKGEMDGEFEAFYLAVDHQGQTYINRSIDFSLDAYHKSKGWEEISRQELERFEKQLHFTPARSKGLKP